MEHAIVHGVRTSPAKARVTVVGVPDHPGVAARVFRVVADLGVDLGIVAQSSSPAATGRTDITFTLARIDGPMVATALQGARERIGFDHLILDDRAAEVTLSGLGMRADPAIAAAFCEALAMTGVPMEAVSIESRRISAVCEKTRLDDAVHALCSAFEVGVIER